MSISFGRKLMRWMHNGTRNKRLRAAHRFHPRVTQLEERSLLNTGGLDLTFGNRGALYDSSLLTAKEATSSAAVQPDGKIVVVGTAGGDLALVRYHRDGSLDTTFGDGGLVKTDLGATDYATSLSITSDGRIIVAGVTYTFEPFPPFILYPWADGTLTGRLVLARYAADGSLDASYGQRGIEVTNLSASWLHFSDDIRHDMSVDLAMQTDGKVLVTSSLLKQVARFDQQGSLDLSFGKDGLVSTTEGATPIDVGLDGAGNVLVVGKIYPSPTATHSEFFVARYGPDGSPDIGFDADGVATVDFGNSAAAYNAAVLPDGRIVVVGGVEKPNSIYSDAALARFNPDGSLDASFGKNGTTTATEDGRIYSLTALALQADGKILVATQSGFGLARFNSDGAFDTWLGYDRLSNRPAETLDDRTGFVLQPDGRVVVVANAGPFWRRQVFVGRFETGAPTAVVGAVSAASPVQRFVTQLYHDLLQRDPDDFGLLYWTRLVAGGVARPEIVSRFQDSTEYRTRAVQDLYLTFLHRHAEPYGLGFFLGELASGETVEDVRTQIVGSPEYWDLRGDGRTGGFLDAIYQDALQRVPDDLGRGYFTQLLDQSTPTSQVADLIFSSEEYRRNLVQIYYGSLLARDAEQHALEFWASVLQARKRSEGVLAGIAGSDEYFARV